MLETYVIHVTKECNMQCVYCYEKDKESTYTEEEIVSLCTEITKNAKEPFVVEFLGGEPLLAFDNIKIAYKTFEDNKTAEVYPVRYIITTNGTILNSKIIEFVNKDKKISIAISLDGHRTANFMRNMKINKNSYDVVVANIDTMIRNNILPSVHIVTHPYNVGYLFDSIRQLNKLGIRCFGVGTVESTIAIDKEYCRVFVNEMLKVSKYIKNDNITVDILDYIKPVTDVRTYLYDKNGKQIGETYGRMKDDITTKDTYTSKQTSSNMRTVIEELRRVVYDNHVNNTKTNPYQ